MTGTSRLLDEYDAIVDADCIAWNELVADAGRLTSLKWLPWAPRTTATIRKA